MTVLFLCHVDAKWIKQRPHFVAEELQTRLGDLIFAYARAYDRSSLTEQVLSGKALSLLLVPQRLRGRLRWADELWQRAVGLMLGVFLRPRLVWVTSPRMAIVGQSAARVSRAKLVADVMDRTSEFSNAAPQDVQLERRLLRNADLAVCSSETLLEDVTRVRGDLPTHLMRNALADPGAWLSKVSVAPKPRGGGQVTLGYAGSVSTWFDWTLMLSVLNENPGWRLRVWGPADSVPPAHPQVVPEGTVAHSLLPRFLNECDVLVMPFRVTPLIAAVDPVKAYEYVATGRPVVLVRYRETEHFAAWAHLYAPGDSGSFQSAVSRALQDGVSEGNLEFAEGNTWRSRINDLLNADGWPLC